MTKLAVTAFGLVLVAASARAYHPAPAPHASADAPTHPGVVGTPPPVLPDGSTGKIVYRMGPVVADGHAVATEIRCANTGTTAVTIGVELFGPGGAPTGPPAFASTPAGATTTFSTDPNGVGSVIPLATTVTSGKARVSATAGSIVCTGVNRLQELDGSPVDRPLELIKRLPVD